MNLFRKWLLILAVAGLAASVEMGSRANPVCSASKLDCVKSKFLPAEEVSKGKAVPEFSEKVSGVFPAHGI